MLGEASHEKSLQTVEARLRKEFKEDAELRQQQLVIAQAEVAALKAMKNASNGNALQEQKLLVTKLQKELNSSQALTAELSQRVTNAESRESKANAQLANVESRALATLADKERIERDLNIALKDLEAERVRCAEEISANQLRYETAIRKLEIAEEELKRRDMVTGDEIFAENEEMQALRTALLEAETALQRERSAKVMVEEEVAKRCASYANGVAALQVELEQTKERLAQEAAAAKQRLFTLQESLQQNGDNKEETLKREYAIKAAKLERDWKERQNGFEAAYDDEIRLLTTEKCRLIAERDAAVRHSHELEEALAMVVSQQPLLDSFNANPAGQLSSVDGSNHRKQAFEGDENENEEEEEEEEEDDEEGGDDDDSDGDDNDDNDDNDDDDEKVGGEEEEEEEEDEPLLETHEWILVNDGKGTSYYVNTLTGDVQRKLPWPIAASLARGNVSNEDAAVINSSHSLLQSPSLASKEAFRTERMLYHQLENSARL